MMASKLGERTMTMAKRLLILTLLCLVAVGVAPVTMADSDCDHSYSNYARAVMLHDAGDYERALYHYACALENKPDDSIIPIMIENAYADIDSSGAAWSRGATSSGAVAAGEPFIPEWLQPYEMMSPASISTPRFVLLTREQPFRRIVAAEVEEAGRLPVTTLASAPGPQPDLRRVSSDQIARLDAADYARFASWFIKRDDWARAATALSKALKLEPFRHDLRCQLGGVYASGGEGEAALAAFDYVLSQDPGHICANEHRRALLRSMNAAAAPAPVSPAQATYEQGLRFYEARKLYAAAQILLEALEIDPGHRAARCQVGLVFSEWGNYTRALDEFQLVLAADPQDECAVQQRKLTIRKLLNMYLPLTVDDFFNHARTYARIEDWALARDYFEKGLSFDPGRSDARCELGMLYDKLGDQRAALREFDRVLSQQGVDSCAWSNREGLIQRLRELNR